MWIVRGKPVHLTYHMGKLFKIGASTLARRLVEHASPDVGCPPFDQCAIPRQLATLSTVTQGLLSRSRPTAFPNVWLDAAVAATTKHVEQALEGHTYFDPDLAVSWERLVRRADAQERRERPGRRVTVLAKDTVRSLRQRWTTLDWSWTDTLPDAAHEQWVKLGHDVFGHDADDDSTLPEDFFFVPPPDPGTAETERHFAYLVGLTEPRQRREVKAAEDAFTAPAIARATRRVQI